MDYLINEKGFANNPLDFDFEAYRKYIDWVLKLGEHWPSGVKFLDVGCGAGQVVNHLGQKITRGAELVGIDIGRESVAVARQGSAAKFFQYDGRRIPLPDNYFNIVGSNNVLEHVDDPVCFLSECFRVLGRGGYLIVACPNFLSVTNSYHNHTRGGLRKIINFYTIFGKLFSRQDHFLRMPLIRRPQFQPDDDAGVVTNPLDILHWANSVGLQLIYWSSQSVYKDGFVKVLDRSFLRLFLGASFFVFQKPV
jgi:ubiquinone/menaquinone biosynthesis C-methylase UbiE